ncbi:MAG: ACT domain-containing protein [Syntrophales bacterium]|nr:ACT domain-containing protein [Syntrophales bacterium]MDD4996514.1 ACT domain-containing protein [Syntrophales bacterium]MDD5531618.1 ACT domain-containing protein [Syntrophales bacterium]HPL64490.1 ACT domain-containing protein [Syntrophales bacterium]
MKITQLSAFIENRAGVMAEMAEFLGENRVNIRALSIAESRDFGVVRMIVHNPEAAARLLAQKGYSVQTVEVLAVRVADEPGGLARALRVLADENLNVDYLYTFLDKLGDHAVVILRVDNPDYADSVLHRSGFSLLSQEELGML